MKPISSAAACLMLGALTLSVCSQAYAAPSQAADVFTNVSGTVDAGVQNSKGGSSDSENLSASSPTQTATASGIKSTSTTTGSLTGNSFAATFAQTFSPKDYSTYGDATLDFTAGVNADFTIQDLAPVVIPGNNKYQLTYETYLEDVNTGEFLYQDESGELFGNGAELVAGDMYEFKSDVTFGDLTDPTIAYTPTLNLTPTAPTSVTPEPSSFLLLGTGLLGVAGTIKRRLA